MYTTIINKLEKEGFEFKQIDYIYPELKYGIFSVLQEDVEICKLKVRGFIGAAIVFDAMRKHF